MCVYRCYTCSISTMSQPICLTESVSFSINVAPVYTVNINTKTIISLLPELGAVSQSHHQRWWLVWRRQRRRGHSFQQLELSPSGSAHGQKNPISRKTQFKLNTHKQSQHLALVRLAAMLQLPAASPKQNLTDHFKFITTI